MRPVGAYVALPISSIRDFEASVGDGIEQGLRTGKRTHERTVFEERERRNEGERVSQSVSETKKDDDERREAFGRRTKNERYREEIAAKAFWLQSKEGSWRRRKERGKKRGAEKISA